MARKRIGIAAATALAGSLLFAPTAFGDAVQDGAGADRAPQTSNVSEGVVHATDPEQAEVRQSEDDILLGYFIQWGVYDRNYHVKNVETSGSAEKLTHINYAFGDVRNGECVLGDEFADYQKAYTAEESVDGEADEWDQELRGNFNQLRKLKEMYPDLEVLFSFGGWTWSDGFTQAAENPERFAESCDELLHDDRWDGVFDGIDLDWEYPNACGEQCDDSGPDALSDLMSATRAEFDDDELVTAAISADATDGGVLESSDYADAAQYVDWYNVMTYDFFGAFDAEGPTAPHSPLYSYDGIPDDEFTTQNAIDYLTDEGIESSKLVPGVGFYGRGWTGVEDEDPGGEADGPAHGTYEDGMEDYKVLKDECSPTDEIGGTAYAYCNGDWWGYDTPDTLEEKSDYVSDEGLGGVFFWELSGDTEDGELISALD